MFKKIFSCFLIATFLAPSLVLADGMMIKPDPYGNRWDFVSENNQQAYINYEDGLEKLILSIGLEEADSEAVWIFPVPADPQKVVIDILTETPNLRGEEINKKAKSELEDIKEALLLTQIYPAFFTSLTKTTTLSVQTNKGWGLSEDGYGRQADVIIYEHLEKEGMTTEIITARTSKGLQEYFKSKKLDIGQDSIPALNHYIGKEFTFVASWISKSSTTRSSSKQKGVFVTFPTEKIYYPLVLTSVYGSERIPTTIRVVGFVSPKVFKDIKNYTEVEYYIDEYVNLNNIDNFYNGDRENVKYTKIEMNAPSKLLTQDLWMSTRQPLRTFFPSFISQHPFATGIILLVLISILTSILAGLVIFREARNKKEILKFGLLGLFNCLTIIALIIRLHSLRIRKNDEKNQVLINKLKEQGYLIHRKDSKRKMTFVAFYSMTYVVLVVLIISIIEKAL